MKKLLCAVLTCVTITLVQASSVPAGIIKLTTGVFANGGQIRDVKIDNNNKIVACGYTLVGGQNRWTVARFTSAGVLDNTFNSVGYQQWAMDGSVANSLVIQSNNKIVVVGRGNGRAQLFRYNTDGSITSGEGPIDITGVNTSTAVGVTIDNTGTYILTTAFSNNAATPIQYISRINVSNMSLVNLVSRATTGIANTANVDFFVGYAVVKPSNDLLSYVFETGTSNSSLYIIAFPYNGVISNSNYAGNHNIVCQDNSVILQSRWFSNSHNVIKATNGIPVGGTTFFVLPSTSTTFPYNAGGGLALAESNSKILLCAGTTTSSVAPQPFISRLIVADGSFDNTFGSAGKTVQTQVSVTPGYYAAVGLQSDGKAVAGGFTDNGNVNSFWILSRYTTTGTLDTSFVGVNPTGLFQDNILAPFNTGAHGAILSTVIDPSGKLVVGGYYGTNAMAARYNVASSPVRDSTFDSDGVLLLTSLATTSSLNKIVTIGTGYLAVGQSNNQLTSVKITSAGVLDDTYGNGGVVQETTLGTGTGVSVVVNTDGTLVVSGQSTVSGVLLSTLVAYTATGSRLPRFGTGGVQTYGATFGAGILNDIIAPRAGKLTTAGQMGTVATLLQVGQSSSLLDELNNGF